MQPASLFDLDGTLTKGYMITEFANHLMKKNLFSKKGNNKIKSLKKLFLSKKITYREVAVRLPEIFANSLEGTKSNKVNKETKIFTQKIIDNRLFSYTNDLVALMKSYGLTIGISGSPIEVVGIMGKYFDFDSCYGTEVEVLDGRYTGKLKQNLIAKEGKEAVFETIIKQNLIDLEKSFGFGDTAQDMAFLSKVGYPVAVNPNRELLKIANEKNWIICQSEEVLISKINAKLNKIKLAQNQA